MGLPQGDSQDPTLAHVNLLEVVAEWDSADYRYYELLVQVRVQ